MRRSLVSIERLEAVARAALLGGYGKLAIWDPDRVDDPLAGKFRRQLVLDTTHGCEDPVGFELFSNQSAYSSKRLKPFTVIGTARCRKCEACRKARSAMWRMRAINEYKKWPVTMFGTVTMSPEQHYLLDARIQSGLKDPDGTRWVRYPQPLNLLSSEEQFRMRVRVFGEDLQRYFKRLRKGEADRRPNFRYLLVAEAHDSVRTAVEMRGRPHFHLLIHEVEAGSLFRGNPVVAQMQGEDGEYVRRRYMSSRGWRDGVFLRDDAFARKQWQYGFTKFQYAENEKAASYLCKYLTKTNDARVRASIGYGENAPERKPDLIGGCDPP